MNMNKLKLSFTTATINHILDEALDRKWVLYFLNNETQEYQAYTLIQLLGLRKFGRILILLETGQTYQIGMGIEENGTGTFQEIDHANIYVDDETLAKIKRTR